MKAGSSHATHTPNTQDDQREVRYTTGVQEHSQVPPPNGVCRGHLLSCQRALPQQDDASATTNTPSRRQRLSPQPLTPNLPSSATRGFPHQVLPTPTLSALYCVGLDACEGVCMASKVTTWYIVS